MWGILFIVLAVAFIVMSIGMYKYLIDVYTKENNIEKGFILIKKNDWEN